MDILYTNKGNNISYSYRCRREMRISEISRKPMVFVNSISDRKANIISVYQTLLCNELNRLILI